MRRVVALCLLLGGCFEDAPPVDDVGDGAMDESSSEAGDSEGSSSSGGEPVDPLDAYGPCEVDTDCPLVPGDEGEVGESPRCVAGTCAIRCAQAPFSDGVCPGYYEFRGTPPDTFYPIVCGDDGYCTITRDPHNPGPGACPDGMGEGDIETVPDIACMWLPG